MVGDQPDMPAPDPRRTLVSNERVKLSATYMNGLAIAVFAVGGLSPFIAALGIVTDRQGLSTGGFVLLIICSLASGALHFAGRVQLGRLDV